jgi:hypothetical protein
VCRTKGADTWKIGILPSSRRRKSSTWPENIARQFFEKEEKFYNNLLNNRITAGKKMERSEEWPAG